MSTKKKIIWFLVSCLMALSLVMASCGPAAEEAEVEVGEEEVEVGEGQVEVEEEEEEEEEVTVSSDRPQYGGTITLLYAGEYPTFDSGAYPSGANCFPFYQNLQQQDWSKGPAGSGELTYASPFCPLEGYTGCLMESWETPELGTWVFKIRKGVHWQDNPASEASRLMNGREFTADDVIYNFQRMKTSPKSVLMAVLPAMAEGMTMEKTDDWTIVLKTAAGWEMMTWTCVVYGLGWFLLYPPEVIEEYGDVLDWRNTVGTGPYMLTDYVPGTSYTAIRNPNYWDRQPVGPGKGDQLPYVDRFRILIIPELATRLAAMRTDKGDWFTNIPWESAKGLMQTNPELQKQKYLSPNPLIIGMRTDRDDLPFNDKRVRQALTLAVDFEGIASDYYGGEAGYPVWPVSATHGNAFKPLDQCPDAVQELYTHDTDKARQLLAEAGYPEGFNANMVVQSVTAELDMATAIEAMWADIDVNLEIQPKESGVFRATQSSKEYEMIQGYASITFGLYLAGSTWRGPGRYNFSSVDLTPESEPFVEEIYLEMQKNVLVNHSKAEDLMREELAPYLMEQAYVIGLPTPYTYTLWQPWVKNYHGEIGAGSATGSNVFWTAYIWIDQDMKEDMTGAR